MAVACAKTDATEESTRELGTEIMFHPGSISTARGVAVGVGAGVRVEVNVGVGVRVGLAVGVLVADAVAVMVPVGVAGGAGGPPGVGVEVGAGVAVGPTPSLEAYPYMGTETPLLKRTPPPSWPSDRASQPESVTGTLRKSIHEPSLFIARWTTRPLAEP